MMYRKISAPLLIQWLILGFLLIALGVAVGIDLYKERLSAEANEHDRLLAQARLIQDNVASNLAAVSRVLRSLSSEMSRGVTDPHRNERLKSLTEAMPGVRTVLVLNASGTVTASSRPELMGNNFSQRAYFQTALRHSDAALLYVSPPFKTSLGLFAINVVRIIQDSRGAFSGIVAATLDPGYFRTLLASVIYKPDMWVTLSHESGIQFMMVPERDGQAGKNLAQPGSFFTHHRESGREESLLTGVVLATGEERMMALRTIRPASLNMDTGLVVTVGRDLGTIYDAWHRDAWIEITLFALLAGLAGGSLFLYQRWQRQFDQQRAHAAIALQESARFMTLVTDNLPGMVGYWTAELRCGFANVAYREWFNKTPEQMQGIHIRDLLGEQLFPLNEPHILAALSGKRQQFELTLTKADGSTGHTLASYIPDIDGEQVRGFFVLVTDITEQKRREIEFKDLLEFNQLVIAKTESGITVHRYTGECILVNEAAERILGATNAQIQEHNFRKNRSWRNLGILEIADRVLRTGVSEQVDSPMHTSFGKDIWYVGYLVRLNIKGEGYLLSVFNDISERKKAEHAMREAKEVAETLLDRAKLAEWGILYISEETQARIGQELHDDLGQHLTGVAFLSEVLFQKLRSKGQEEQQEAAHITELINAAVVKTRRLAQGLYPVELKEAGLQAMLEQLARNVVSIYKLACEVSFEDDIGIDDLQTALNLYRVAQESINNAIRHGNANFILLRMYRSEAGVVFEISDNGSGIRNIEEIMKKGGLGLNTMRYRVSAIGATLNIYAREGGGTRLVINLSARPGTDSDAVH